MSRANHRILYILLTLLAAFLILTPTYASTEQTFKEWNRLILHGDLFHSKKFQYLLITHLRFEPQDNIFESNINRFALGYTVIPHVSVWLGYTYIVSFDHPRNIYHYENQFWQQLFVHALHRKNFQFRTRSRLEERFRTNQPATSWRFRQRITAEFPRVINHNLGFILSDELFFNLNKVPWVTNKTFDQNRALAGLVLYYNHSTRLVIGYMNQFLHRNPSNRIGHIFYFALIVNTDELPFD